MSKLTYVPGDLFSAPPPRSILVHACNTMGTWGAGIALAFRDRYPQEFEQYKAHCKTHGKVLVGTCLLIKGEEHDIACLFTSRAYGKKKDTQDEILEATKRAINNLLAQNKDKKELHACRFNSGKFGVPWEKTEEILQELSIEMTVYDPILPLEL